MTGPYRALLPTRTRRRSVLSATVVSVISLVVAQAIIPPTVAGAKRPASTTTAGDRTTQMNLYDVLIDAKAFYASHGSYLPVGALTRSIKRNDARLTIVGVNTASRSSRRVSLDVKPDGQQVVAVASSPSGACWVMSDSTESTGNLGNAPGDSAGTGWARSRSAPCAASYIASIDVAPSSWTSLSS